MKPLKIAQPCSLGEYLANQLSHLKRTQLKQLLKFGSVQVNSRVVTSYHHALKIGDTVDFLNKKEAVVQKVKETLSARILYEDAEVLVADKPDGLLTMGTDTEKINTLYFELTEYEKAKRSDGLGRVFIVHRLDRDTSGLVLFAKNPKAKQFLQDHWPETIKKYYAVVEGVPKERTGTLRSFLKEDKFRRVYSLGKRTADAKEALTHYRVIRDNGSYALLDLELETGRKNQLRVQLSDLGTPVAGDYKYGAQTNPLNRLALHAYYLEFPHPATGEKKTIRTPLLEVFTLLVRPHVAP